MRKALNTTILSPQYVPLFEAARRHHKILSSHNSIESVLNALADTREETYPERSALIHELVIEQHNEPHPLWAAALLLAFYPMLVRLRSRIAETTVLNDELEQIIVTSFLSVIAQCNPQKIPDRIAVWLKHQTRRRVFKSLSRSRLSQKTEIHDTIDKIIIEKGSGWPEFKTEDHKDLYNPKDATRAVLALLDYGSELLDAECFDLVITTAYCQKTLISYVRRISTNLDIESSSRLYERTRRRYHRAISRLRASINKSRYHQIVGSRAVTYSYYS